MIRWLSVVAVGIVGLVAAPRVARACSCSGDSGVQIVQPRDGATSVPTDAIVVVAGPYDEEVTLRGAATMAPVAVTERRWNVFPVEHWLMLDPVDHLQPNTEYEIMRSQGESTRFTTGSNVDETPPAFAGLSSFAAHDYPANEECSGSSCWSYGQTLNKVTLDYPDPPEDVVLLHFEIRRQGEAEPFFSTVLHENSAYGRDGRVLLDGCDPIAPDVVAGVEYCVRVVAYDQSGNTAGDGTEVCASADACMLKAETGCWPTDECLPVDGGGSSPGNGDGGCSLYSGTKGHRSGPLLALLLLLAVRSMARRPRSATELDRRDSGS